MKVRRGQAKDDQNDEDSGSDPFKPSDRFKTEKKATDEGSVTNSMAMLTAILEVDLGMECVLSSFREPVSYRL